MSEKVFPSLVNLDDQNGMGSSKCDEKINHYAPQRLKFAMLTSQTTKAFSGTPKLPSEDS